MEVTKLSELENYAQSNLLFVQEVHIRMIQIYYNVM